MLISALIRIQLKKIFIGKEKIAINVLTAFYIFHKNDVKTFLRALVNISLKTILHIFLYNFLPIHISKNFK